MSVQKERRIKKLSKKRIWPSILAMILLLLVFLGACFAISDLFLSNLIQNKVNEGMENARKVAQIFDEEEAANNGNKLEVRCKQLRIFIPQIQDICVVGNNDQVIRRFGERIPDFSRELILYNHGGQRMILGNAGESFISVDGQDINFDMRKLLEQSFQEKLEFSLQGDMDNSEEHLINMDCWFIAPLAQENTYVCVLNEVVIQDREVYFVFLAMGGAFLLVNCFCIYYLFAIIRLVLNRRRVMKILYTDTVTGGNNWIYFVRKSTRIIQKNRRNWYALIQIRMEKYRNYSTCYGIKEGEELLEQLYNSLAKEVKSKETVAHKEHADYCLLLQYKDERQLEKRLEQILQHLAVIRPGRKMYFSVGICRVLNRKDDPEVLYNYADIARSVIAEDGSRRMAWFNEDMYKQQLWERRVEDDMERALHNKEFQVYLQPKYSTASEKLSGAEALVRWIHPTEGFVPPNRFIPIFENNGFILQLDDYMLTEVARQQAKWLSEGKRLVPISVNVSRVHFRKEDLAEHICGIVDSFKVPHEYIELELTESAFFDDKEVLLRIVSKLKNYGFKVSMDDFGAGYSSLNTLKELPLDIVKLDAEFFRGNDNMNRGKMIVEETIRLAKKLDMEIVAEGIETKEQVDFLAENNCDLIQGFYFAKPMPIKEYEERAFADNK